MRRYALRLRLALVLAACGCTLASPYPDVAIERDALCHDDLDEDLDGLVDCDDPGCDAVCDERFSCEPAGAAAPVDEDEDGLIGCADPDCDGDPACPEDVEAQCADGRDNDGDGRIDARDAGCWPLAIVEIERCASVLGGTVDVGPEDFREGTLEADPLGTGEGPWRLLDPTAASLSTVRASGGTAGATARIELRYAPGPAAGAAPWLAFNAGLAAPSSTREPETVRVYVGADGTGRVSLFLPPFVVAVGTLPPITGAVRVEIDLELEPTPDFYRARVRVEGAAEVVLEGTSISTAPPTSALAIYAGAVDRTYATTWLERATLTRPTLERCGTREPPLGIVVRDGVEQAHTVLHGLARGPDAVLCGTASLGLTTYSIVSRDDGASFVRGESLLGGEDAWAAARQPLGVAFDPVTETFHVATSLLATVGLAESAIYVSSSEDCEHWSRPLVGAPIPSAIASEPLRLGVRPGPAEYEITREGHRLTFSAFAGALGLLYARSPWGDPGTWVFDDALDPELPTLGPFDPAILETGMLRWRTEEHGARVSLEPGLAVRVRTSRGWQEVPDLAVAASGEAGAFDAQQPILPIRLLEDACDPPTERGLCGRLYYTGGYDRDDLAGWGHVRVRITPRSL